MNQTSLKEQFLQLLEKKAEKVQKAKEEKTNFKVVENTEKKEEMKKPVRRRRKKILDDDDD